MTHIYGDGVPNDLKDFGKYLALVLLHPLLAESLQIEIEFDCSPNSAGYTICEELGAGARLAYFTVGLNPIAKTCSIYETLAHEMVHVAQYTTRRLIDGEKNGDVYWEGQLYSGVKCLDYNSFDDYPWEIEAHEMERVLVKSWLAEEIV